MTTLLLAGDIHGNPHQMLYLYEQAMKHDVDCIFSLGDFGYWEHMGGGPEFLEVVSNCAIMSNIDFFWLDGNHENHVLLRKTYDTGNYNEFWKIRDGVYYSPRGHKFTWDGITFLTMGGAYSVDRNRRRIGTSWWWEEVIEADEVERASAAGKIDVLLSHDVPEGVDMARLLARRGGGYSRIPGAEKNRVMLREVVDATLPRFVFHGHYHVNYREDFYTGDHKVTVFGLGCDGMEQDSWTIIDTEQL